MADNLPLIPEKDSAVCADVRPVLREVFRELDWLPPLTGQAMRTRDAGDDADNTLPKVEPWMHKYDMECKEIWEREGDLKHQHAKRISREPLPNIYKLHPPKQKEPKGAAWKKEQGILQRQDLIPSIVQNARRDESLWVQNILNRSSGDLADAVEVRGSRMHLPLQLHAPSESHIQSMSIGEIAPRPPPLVPPPAPPAMLPEPIICVPPQLDFVNFTVGKLQTQKIRLVNVTKLVLRLSIRPPRRLELDVELCSARGLTVSSGAAAEFKVHFRPRDVRVLRDVLVVRVSTGSALMVPICCYMQPPLLDILVPMVSSSVFSCSPGSSAVGQVARGGYGGDVLELGARLLGDVHHARLLLHCEADHVSFFLVTEDAWLTFELNTLTSDGSLVADPFVVSPAWWRGGGSVPAVAWCRAHAAGLHAAPLRVLASTPGVRHLHLLADSLFYRPNHVTIEAHEKDYDICSLEDGNCEYFVHLGTAFPHQPLSAVVQLRNHSPVVYSYYWSVRPWGVCSCWEEEKASQGSLRPEDDSERLCVGAKEARNIERQGTAACKTEWSGCVRVQPTRGSLAARSSCALHVRVPNTGVPHALGTHRAVLMLILKDIPKESFPSDYNPMIVKIEEIQSDPIPGMKSWSREVCEIVCAQMEVWWEVAPVRFVLDPIVLTLTHSRRVQSVEVLVRATQLFGCQGIAAEWEVPELIAAPEQVTMAPAHSCAVTLQCALPMLANDYPETDVLTLKAVDGEWQAQSLVVRQCATRHPRLGPARVCLGVQAPGAHVSAVIAVTNDTHQHICWWSTAYHWLGTTGGSRACSGGTVCDTCHQRACTCALLRPARGTLAPSQSASMHLDTTAPMTDGCVCTLVQMRRTEPDVCRVPSAPGTEARATLFYYRVLAPRLVLRALPCRGDKNHHCSSEGCALDAGAGRSACGGTATLRPAGALALGQLSCYRLRVNNLTPIATAVTWEPPLEDDVLNVVLIPNELQVKSYGEVEFQVVVEARKVCGRRIFVRRARVQHTRPVYLLIDAAVAGLEVLCEVPIGENEKTESTLIMRRSQKEAFPWDAGRFKPSTFEEMFQEEDRKRALRAENICECHCRLVYVAPVKRPRAPPRGDDDYPPIEIVSSPPPMTRVCACFSPSKPVLPDLMEPFALQFKQLPLKTVVSRVVVLRNLSPLAARWNARVRRCPRQHTRTLDADSWAGDVAAPGLCVSCCPSGGVLAEHAQQPLHVQVYADCWGLYHDQLLIAIDKVEPIVLDIWVEVPAEAGGAPLQFALSLTPAQDEPPVLWLSTSAPERTLRVKNKSRVELLVHAYLMTEHEHEQARLPFRLYVRLVDVPPRICPCRSAALHSESCSGEESVEYPASSYEEEMDTDIEIFLGPDYGRQDSAFFQISPESQVMCAGSHAEWRVTLARGPRLAAELAPPAIVLLRALPGLHKGAGWYRQAPAPQAARQPALRAAPRDLRVSLCALALPYQQVLRVRKRFRIQNVGNGPLDFSVRCSAPWSLVAEKAEEDQRDTGCGCGRQGTGARGEEFTLHLLPRSSMAMCVEVRVSTTEEWPAPAEEQCDVHYEQWRRNLTKLHFYDNYNVLLTIPMHFELEYPIIDIEPPCIDFGFVTDGDTRKSYFTVSHSSRTATIDMVAEWRGGEEFAVWPQDFSLQPGGRERVYIQYTARWCGAPSEGYVVAACAGAARGWCRALGRARAAAARDAERQLHVHDYTDDEHLQPLSPPLPPSDAVPLAPPLDHNQTGETPAHPPSTDL